MGCSAGRDVVHLSQVQLFGTFHFLSAFHNGDKKPDYFMYPHNYSSESVPWC